MAKADCLACMHTAGQPGQPQAAGQAGCRHAVAKDNGRKGKRLRFGPLKSVNTTTHIPGETEPQGDPVLFTPAKDREPSTQSLSSSLRRQKILEGRKAKSMNRVNK